MQNSMQDWPLTVDRILDHANRWHTHREVVSRSVEGPIVRTTYGEIHERSKRLSNALLNLGVKKGDRIATLAWNTARHMECWYGIMGIGAVCHTLNPRLFAEQLCYIINHAEDKIIFTDTTFMAMLAENLERLPTVKAFVVLTDEEGMADCPLPNAVSYESLIAAHAPEAVWGGFDETTPAGLCYTSGTTGNPKGVLYTHRSNFMHTFAGISNGLFGMRDSDVMLPIVPLFHANAWGLAFNCPAVGCKLVMPGPKLDGASVYELMEAEGVTYSAGVPTVWQMLLQHMDTTGAKFSTLKTLIVGGSALPEAILRGFHDRYNVEVIAAWGMTETSPLATAARLTPEMLALPYDEQVPYRVKAGRPVIGVELKVVDEEGKALPNDGKAVGNLMVKGAYVVNRYYRAEENEILDSDGFFDTGDVATLDPAGFVTITDRAKDVIKSGGEWISSIEIENIACGYPKTAIAAVVGVAHPKWDERPLLLVKLKPGEEATQAEYLDYLDGKIAKWWMPDAVEFVDDIPLGATGKIDKKVIRAEYAKYVLPSLAAAAGGATLALAADRPEVIYAPAPSQEDDGASDPESDLSPLSETEAEAIVDGDAPPAPEDEPVAEALEHNEAEATFEDIEAPAEPEPAEPEAQAEPAPEPVSEIPAEAIAALVADPVRPEDPTLAAANAEVPAGPPEPAPAEALLSLVPPAPVPPLLDDAPLSMPIQPRRPKRNAGVGKLIGILFLITLAPAAMVAMGAVMVRAGYVDWTVGYRDMLLGNNGMSWAWKASLLAAAAGVLGLVIALVTRARRKTGLAMLGVVIAGLSLAGVYSVNWLDDKLGPIHDVATDWKEPLMLSDKAMAARGAHANLVEADPVLPLNSGVYAGRRVADVNAESCKEAQPLVAARPVTQAFAKARQAIADQGLKLTYQDEANGRLEAVTKTLVYGFKSDVAIRVRQDVAGARIDIRSISRTPSADLGSNCRRVTRLLALMK